MFLVFVKTWLIIELINWFIHLYIYTQIIKKKEREYTTQDVDDITSRVKQLSKEELEHVIRCSIYYNKETHQNINSADSTVDVNTLSQKELHNFLTDSVFAESKLVSTNILNELIEFIKTKISVAPNDGSESRYLFKKWNSNFISFNFKPIIISLVLKFLILYHHLYFRFILGYTWDNYNISISNADNLELTFLNKIYHCVKLFINGIMYSSNIGFLKSVPDTNKKNLLFVHGIGFGYFPYLNVLKKLHDDYNLIIVVLPYISNYDFNLGMGMNMGLASHSDLGSVGFGTPCSNAIYDFIETHHVEKPIILMHSFGTYQTKSLVEDSRFVLFQKMILVDPIIFWIGCFKMSSYVDNPNVKTDNWKEYLIDIFFNFVVYECIYIKFIFYRMMFGPDFWYTDIKTFCEACRNVLTTVVLEKADSVIPANLLYRKISGFVNTKYYDDSSMSHGIIVINEKYYEKLQSVIEN